MKAISFDKQVNFIDAAPPVPAKDEALIQVLYAGICQTDLEIMKGYMGFRGIPGHEFVGRVIQSPSNKSWIGKRVVGEINIGCGTCPFCRQGLERHCPNRSVLGIKNRDGCFAERITLPLKNLHRISEHVSDSEAVLTEPLAAACEILEQVHIQPDHSVAIIGDGRLAQLILRVLVLTGCDLTLIGKHTEKLALAKLFGIKTYHHNTVPDKKYNIIVEASGSQSGFTMASDLLEPRGTLILKSTYHQKTSINLSQCVIDEVTLTGSRCGKFNPAIRLLENKLINTKGLITHQFSLDEYDKAFESASTPNALKTIFRIEL